MKTKEQNKNKATKSSIYPAVYNTTSFFMSIIVLALSLVLKNKDVTSAMSIIFLVALILLIILFWIVMPLVKKKIDKQETDSLTTGQKKFLKFDNVISWFTPLTFFISLLVTIYTNLW